MGCGADRRADAGDDVPARIVGVHNEAELLGCSYETGRSLARQAEHQYRPARRGAHATCAGRMRGINQAFEGYGIGMAESEADAASERSVAQAVNADRPAAL